MYIGISEEKEQTFARGMKQLPESERPYERLEQHGAARLSDAELIAILLSAGLRGRPVLDIAHDVLNQGGLPWLVQAEVEELRQISGIGRVKALQLKACVELGNRMINALQNEYRQPIRTPSDAILFLEPRLRLQPREEFHVLLLDTRNRLIRSVHVGGGGLDAAVIYPRDIFREAVKANAAAIMLAHNHPSGDASPSRSDIDSTARFVEIGTMMGIPVLDHLIIASGGSISLKQRGLM